MNLLNKAENPIYRDMEYTDKPVRKYIKASRIKKIVLSTYCFKCTIGSGQYAAPLNKGKNFVRQMGNFFKSKR